ncbi:MAG: hypothetical protein JNL57_09750 [Bacteroidetes bacterium]|nr:hypothetical protein [Bacteroidota bacterium]
MSAAKAQDTVLLGPWQCRGTDVFTEWQNAGFRPVMHELYGNTGWDAETLAGNNWLADQTWELETDYYASGPAWQHYTLRADRPDVFAEIYINGRFVLATQNAFTAVETDISKYIRTGSSHAIRVILRPVTATGREKKQLFPHPLCADNDSSGLSPYVRKPAYEWGWDFAPRQLRCGLPNGIQILGWNDARINGFAVTCDSLKGDSLAYLSAVISVQTKTGDSAKVLLQLPGGTSPLLTVPGGRELRHAFRVKHPHLWWPNGWYQQAGDSIPFLYTATALLPDVPDGRSVSVPVGIRTVELRQDSTLGGRSFAFWVNGKPLYAKGVNMVPTRGMLSAWQHDSIWVRGPGLQRLAGTGANMLRVWGGGTYEDDWFYNRCDSLGLLVWQDFMFAGSLYPAHKEFIQNVTAEAQYQVRRLRSHPCMALWCGNNETEVAWHNWGWQKKYGIHGADSSARWHEYLHLFDTILRKCVRDYHPQLAYVRTSPLSNWGKPADFNQGDNHYWGVWHGEAPVLAYRTHIPRFASEFGLPSFPLQGYPWDSAGLEDVKSRMLSYKGLGMLQRYLEQNRKHLTTGTGTDMATQSWQLQAWTVETAITAQRMKRPWCMGSLWWQYNDVWPGITWSILDVTGEPKPALALLKKSFAPLIAGPDMGDSTKFMLGYANDGWGDTTLYLAVFRINPADSLTKPVWTQSRRVPAESAGIGIKVNARKLKRLCAKNDSLLRVVAYTQSQPLGAWIWNAGDYDLKYHFPVHLKPAWKATRNFVVRVTQSSARFTKRVWKGINSMIRKPQSKNSASFSTFPVLSCSA